MGLPSHSIRRQALYSEQPTPPFVRRRFVLRCAHSRALFVPRTLHRDSSQGHRCSVQVQYPELVSPRALPGLVLAIAHLENAGQTADPQFPDKQRELSSRIAPETADTSPAPLHASLQLASCKRREPRLRHQVKRLYCASSADSWRSCFHRSPALRSAFTFSIISGGTGREANRPPRYRGSGTKVAESFWTGTFKLGSMWSSLFLAAEVAGIVLFGVAPSLPTLRRR